MSVVIVVVVEVRIQPLKLWGRAGNLAGSVVCLRLRGIRGRMESRQMLSQNGPVLVDGCENATSLALRQPLDKGSIKKWWLPH